MSKKCGEMVAGADWSRLEQCVGELLVLGAQGPRGVRTPVPVQLSSSLGRKGWVGHGSS